MFDLNENKYFFYSNITKLILYFFKYLYKTSRAQVNRVNNVFNILNNFFEKITV